MTVTRTAWTEPALAPNLVWCGFIGGACAPWPPHTNHERLHAVPHVCRVLYCLAPQIEGRRPKPKLPPGTRSTPPAWAGNLPRKLFTRLHLGLWHPLGSPRHPMVTTRCLCRKRVWTVMLSFPMHPQGRPPMPTQTQPQTRVPTPTPRPTACRTPALGRAQARERGWLPAPPLVVVVLVGRDQARARARARAQGQLGATERLTWSHLPSACARAVSGETGGSREEATA